MFIRYKPAMFHDMLTLSYPRIRLYGLFLELFFYTLLAVPGWRTLQISVQDMWEALRKPRELIVCCVVPQVLRFLGYVFLFFRCVLVSVLLCLDFLIVKDSSLFYF